MAKTTIEFSLDANSINMALKKLEKYRDWLKNSAEEICYRLAYLGATKATVIYSKAAYTGVNDIKVVVSRDPEGYIITASGESLLFIEFGSGIKYGSGHPLAQEMGYGPGTYPGKGHWNDPSGWYLPKEKGGLHTFGNPPSPGMYEAGKTIREEVERISREVLSGGNRL